MSVRILLIEDDPSLCMLVTRALFRAGHETTCEQRGDTGLRRALEDPFELIMVDGQLPGMSGLEVVRNIRRQNSHVPVLFFSGSGSEFQQEAIAAGADCFLAKPCGLDAIVDAVECAAALKRPGATDPTIPIH